MGTHKATEKEGGRGEGEGEGGPESVWTSGTGRGTCCGINNIHCPQRCWKHSGLGVNISCDLKYVGYVLLISMHACDLQVLVATPLTLDR